MNDVNLFKLVRKYTRKVYKNDGLDEIETYSSTDFNKKFKEELTQAKEKIAKELIEGSVGYAHYMSGLAGYMMFDSILKELDKK